MKKRVLDLNQKILIITISILSILAFTGCTLQESENTIELPLRNEIIQEVDEDVIAVVNGNKVHIEEFNLIYETVKSNGVYENLDELKGNILETLIKKAVKENKIKELGITATDEEARAVYRKVFEGNEMSFEEFVEMSYDTKESDLLNVAKGGIKEEKLFEMNTIIGDENLTPKEIVTVKEEYLNVLIKEADIGVQEKYFDLISENFAAYKLRVKD